MGFLPLPLALLPPRAPLASLLLRVVGGSFDGQKEYLLAVDSLLYQRHGVEPCQALLVKVKEVGGDLKKIWSIYSLKKAEFNIWKLDPANERFF